MAVHHNSYWEGEGDETRMVYNTATLCFCVSYICVHLLQCPFLLGHRSLMHQHVPSDADAPQPSPTDTPSSPKYTPPLYLAARAGETEQLLQLLDASPPQNHFSLVPYGSVPLHGAAWAHSPAYKAVLMDQHVALDRNFDPKSIQNKFGETPIESARGWSALFADGVPVGRHSRGAGAGRARVL